MNRKDMLCDMASLFCFRMLQAAGAVALACGMAYTPAAHAAESGASPSGGKPGIQREIIPGSELMSAQERERYRLRLQGAGTPEERERLRAEHVRAMEARARLRGLKLIDYSREKPAP